MGRAEPSLCRVILCSEYKPRVNNKSAILQLIESMQVLGSNYYQPSVPDDEGAANAPLTKPRASAERCWWCFPMGLSRLSLHMAINVNWPQLRGLLKVASQHPFCSFKSQHGPYSSSMGAPAPSRSPRFDPYQRVHAE